MCYPTTETGRQVAFCESGTSLSDAFAVEINVDDVALDKVREQICSALGST